MHKLLRCFFAIYISIGINTLNAQELCMQWNAVADSISHWNGLRQLNKHDTVFTRKLVVEKYKTLLLLQQQPSSVSSFVFWQLPDSLLEELQQCWQTWCTTNGYILVQQPADANGFRRVSVYADKQQKKRIALYDRSTLDAGRITIGISTQWMNAAH